MKEDLCFKSSSTRAHCDTLVFGISSEQDLCICVACYCM